MGSPSITHGGSFSARFPKFTLLVEFGFVSDLANDLYACQYYTLQQRLRES
jgi:hypothetical protein